MRSNFFYFIFYFHNSENKTVAATVQEVLCLWEAARIPTMAAKSAVRKVENLFKEWEALLNSKGREKSRTKEEQFEETLCDLFDIAHADAMTLMTISDDREFLAAQREKGRRGIMQGVYKVLERRVQRREMTVAVEKRSQEAWSSQQFERAVLASSSYSVASIPSRGGAAATAEPTEASFSKRRARWGSWIVLSQELASAFDRTGVSDRKALRIVAATASSLGHDPNELLLNAESIRQARACYRSQLAAEVKTTFVSDTPLTVHWDGKILPDCDGTRGDRLAIVVPILLDAVGAERAFLSKEPEEWPSDAGFVVASRRVSSLRVTNETAERRVALIQSFNLNLQHKWLHLQPQPYKERRPAAIPLAGRREAPSATARDIEIFSSPAKREWHSGSGCGSGPRPEVAYSPARARGRMLSTVERTRSPTGRKDGHKWLLCC